MNIQYMDSPGKRIPSSDVPDIYLSDASDKRPFATRTSIVKQSELPFALENKTRKVIYGKKICN